MALYLDPRPTDIEVIEAIRYHFPISVQRAMLSTQLYSIREALDLLKQVEIMESHEMYNKSWNFTTAHGHNTSRPGPAQHTGNQNWGQGQVRHTQYHQHHSRNNNYRGPRQTFIAENGRTNRGLEGLKFLTPRPRHLTPAMKASGQPHLGQTPAGIQNFKCRRY
jgi:hypothetical protein